ncbi:MAG: hypothetical protein LBU68_00955 [Rickettsiales bacterium]|jgi:hypothetical protein|nr:hypothetical protein [Rickettsiales bacterium]
MEENFNNQDGFISPEIHNQNSNQNIENHIDENEFDKIIYENDIPQEFVSGDYNTTENINRENITSQNDIIDTNQLQNQNERNISEKIFNNVKEFLSNTIWQSKQKTNLYTAEECISVSSENTNIYKYKNGFIFSNTISLLLISILIIIYIQNITINKMKNFYKSEYIWILFCLFSISFIASTTNFPLKFSDNYNAVVYINQVMMFVIGLVFFHNLISKKEQ